MTKATNNSQYIIEVHEDMGRVDLYIRGAIETAETTGDVITQLRTLAREYGTLHAYINTVGGCIDSAADFMAVFDEFETVITIGSGRVMSAGFILWIKGHVRTLTPLTSVMIHREGYSMVGQTFNHIDYAAHNDRLFSNLFTSYVDKGYITQEEYERCKTSNVYFTPEEMIARNVCIPYDQFKARSEASYPVTVVRIINIDGVDYQFLDDSNKYVFPLEETENDDAEATTECYDVAQLVYYGVDHKIV